MLDQYRARQDRDFAREMVFRRVSLRDSIVVPLVVGIVSAVRVLAFNEGLPEPLDAILRETVDGLFRSYDERKPGDADVASIMQPWLSLTLPPPNLWNSLATRLDLPLRAPVACGLGRRYVVLGKPRRSALFFQDALDHTKEDEYLHGFAREELARLKAPPDVPRP